MTSTAAQRKYDVIDLSADNLWAGPPDERDRLFAELRRDRPVSWQRPFVTPMMTLLGQEPPPGYWAVVSREDIVTVSRNTEVFSHASGVMFEDLPDEVRRTSFLLAMDEPAHGKYRRLVSSVFTPKRLAQIRDQIDNQARLIVDDIAQHSDDVEFVSTVSARLPLWTVSEMVGVPEEWHDEIREAALGLVGQNDAEVVGDSDPVTVMVSSVQTLHDRCHQIIDARRRKPENDLITALAQAEIDGERLTDDDISNFFTLLCVAGSDAPMHATTHTVRALSAHPEQRAYLLDDLDGRLDTAIEEFLRWSTPPMTFRRTALQPYELSGAMIEPGDRVVIFVNSGNRDEKWFADPYRFDITRKPNPHIAFGGGGPHYCLGSHVAKMQLRAIFTELYRRLPDIETVGEPEYLASTFIHGIKRQYVRFTPES
ncbi:cytochrome P450 [Mycobacterium sp. CVI_P3]|uniref:Cytochrome P450 n=1 Tax=Mycobacterium pinniadriaticum TaxID=2994102 RepID=A0ABT3SKZ4_9MYCO|nr:cytochrome P450 [Mycobacterium pinniadriaticum]MCX2933769.1 cytochrome P450 [Mycobacterium pinniadriaticum]MCX2940191.1 cytochrome P450 [Mycobacterium pinniadriaticum]